MDIWEILGIDKTKDKDIIKNAYRDRLKSVNPEDDQEGFKILRNAYENALAYSDEDNCDDEITADDEKSDIYIKLETLYSDFYKRIDVSSWEKLFDEECFVSLDTEEEAFNELMLFIMKNYYLPARVFKFINQHFSIHDRIGELKQIYPDDFVDFIISSEKFDAVNYDLFEFKDEDFLNVDRYIALLFTLLRWENSEEINKCMMQIDEIKNLYHPYTDAFKARFIFTTLLDKYDRDGRLLRDDAEAIKIGDFLKAHYEKYDDAWLGFCVCEYYYFIEEYELAENMLNDILKREPFFGEARSFLGNVYYKSGKYMEAREIFRGILEENNAEWQAYNMLFRINMEFWEKNKELIASGKADNNLKFDVAWGCYQNRMMDEALNILESLEPDEEELFQYNNLKGRAYHEKGCYDEALDCFFTWKLAIEKLINSGEELSDEDKNKTKRLPFVNSLIGRCYTCKKQYAEAEKYIDEALAMQYDEDILYVKAELLYQMKEYTKCLSLCDKLLEGELKDVYNILAHKLKSCFYLGYYQDCIYTCEKAKRIDSYIILPYIYEIKVFQRVNQYDDAKQVINAYKEINNDSDSMTYYEAKNYRYTDDDEQALKLLEKLYKPYDSQKTDMYYEDYIDMLFMLADMYDDADRDKEAIRIYKKILKLEPDNDEIHGCLAYMYKKINELDKALREYKKQIKREPHALYYSAMGEIYVRKLDYKAALKNILKALELDPHRKYCLRKLGQLYHLMGEYEKALPAYDNAMEFFEDNELWMKLETIRWKARTLTCMKQYDAACDILFGALKEYGDNADSGLRYELALTYTRADRYTEAKDILLEYIEDDNGDVLSRYWDAKLLMELSGEEGYIDTTRYAYQKAISFDVNHTNLHHQYGRVLFFNECYEEAKEQYELAVTDEGEEWYSELLETIKMLEGAIDKDKYSDYINKVEKLKEALISPRECIRIAKMYRVLENYDEAAIYLKKALDMNICNDCGYMGCEEAYYEFGLLYEAMGEYVKAKNSYNKALEAHGHCGAYVKRRDAI